MNRYAVSCNGKECGSIVAASYSAAIAVAFTEINESKVTQMAVVLTDKNIKLKPRLPESD